ncbi:MAG: hypothetical protein U0V74_06080 [Chitinophagales bacterium]
MRTFHLVKAFTESELKEVEKLLNDGKRQNLLSLFRYLRKRREQPEKPTVNDLLKHVFKQKSTKQNELQLRNKLSRLNEILSRHLVLMEFKNHTESNRHLHNQWLITAFRARKVPLVNTDIDGFIKTAQESFMLDEALPMLRLRALINDNPFDKNIINLNEWQKLEAQRFLFHYTVAESTRATCYQNENNRLQKEDSIWKKYKAPDYIFNFNELKIDWYFQLFENARLSSLSQSPARRIHFLKKAEKAISNATTEHMLTRGVRENLLTNIALGLMDEGLYEEALEYQQKHFQLTMQKGLTPYAVAYINYMVNLMFLERLDEVKAAYLENRKTIDESDYVLPARFMYVTACLFTNEESKAIRMLHDISPVLEHEKLTMRILYLTSFIMRGELKLAQTEVQNLKRAIAGFKREEYIKDLEQVTLVLSDYVTALKSNGQKLMLNKAKARVKKALQVLNSDPVQFIILKWVIEKLNKHHAK